MSIRAHIANVRSQKRQRISNVRTQKQQNLVAWHRRVRRALHLG
ncbi:MAG: hypothetical protein ABSH27_11410 [Solirubrobacteraceae bacterium]|jgi:hypothetical protein